MGAQEVCAMSTSYRHFIRRIERKLDIHPGSSARMLLALPPGVFVATFAYMAWAFLTAGASLGVALGGTAGVSCITTLFSITLLLAFRKDSDEEAPGLQLLLRQQHSDTGHATAHEVLGHVQRDAGRAKHLHR